MKTVKKATLFATAGLLACSLLPAAHATDTAAATTSYGRNPTYVESTQPTLTLTLEGIDETTGERTLSIPFFDLFVKPGETLSFQQLLRPIQSHVDALAGQGVFKVKGFPAGTVLIEGYSQLSIPIVNGQDITLPKVADSIKRPGYYILGEVLLERLPQTVKPQATVDMIQVIYAPEFFTQSANGHRKQISLYPELELGELRAGTTISSDALKKYAQSELDKKFGAGKYTIVSRRATVSRNVSDTNINNAENTLSWLDENTNFTYTVERQYVDPQATVYRDLISDHFYVKEGTIDAQPEITPTTPAAKPTPEPTETAPSIPDSDPLYQPSQHVQAPLSANLQFQQDILNDLMNIHNLFNDYFNSTTPAQPK